MALTINTNLASMMARRSQAASGNELAFAVARLSSGLRINGARDDAAGLAIADRLTTQIRGTTQAGRNANDGISLAQTAEGGLASIDSNLQRMRELAVQAANATLTSSDRAAMQIEVAQLQSEIDRVAGQTQFNGMKLLDGSFAAQNFQVGANLGQTIAAPPLANSRSAVLGTYAGFSAAGQSLFSHAPIPAPLLVTFDDTGTTISLGAVAMDARAVVNAINAGGIAGLSASADPAVVTGTASLASASATGTASLNINGIAIALPGTPGAAGLAGNRTAAVLAINAQSAATGVVARDTGSRVDLQSADGRNIYTTYSAATFTGSTYRDFGLGANAAAAGTVNLAYVAPPGVTGTVTISQETTVFLFGIGIDYLGLSGTYGIGASGQPVGSIDIGSVGGANAALTSIDSALVSVNTARAGLGAMQNRFAAATLDLASAGANLAASRGRILDADFSIETARLSRAQVLQQAGTAMLAQANQAPAQVLSLLR